MTRKAKREFELENCDCSSEKLPLNNLTWFEKFHPWDFIIAQTTEGKPDWYTISEYPLSRVRLYEYWSSSTQLIGVRFQAGKEGKTCYVAVDIDIGSAYHPYNDEPTFRKILGALENIGLCRYLLVRSSNSQGLHIYFPLPERFSCYWLALVARQAVEKEGFKVAGGQLEIFPNVKSCQSLYNPLRLPLQIGSYVVDEDFHPVHNDLEYFIQTWYVAARGQDTELLRQVIADTKPATAKKSRNTAEWRQRLEETIETGWTSKGQTNRILKELCIYARVFEKLDWDAVEKWVCEKVVKLPGYQNFCGDKRRIKKRVKEWVTTNRRSNRYYPHNSSERAEIAKAPSNDERSADALRRIKDAIAKIIDELGQLPKGVRERQNLICKTAKCSASTLRKHSELWHPDYEQPGCVTEALTRVSGLLSDSMGFDLVDSDEIGNFLECVTVKSARILVINDEESSLSQKFENESRQAVTHPIN